MTLLAASAKGDKMEIQSLDKKLIAALGLAAGAGIALTFTYCSRNERRLPRVKTEPKWTPVRVGGSQNSRPIFVTKPVAIGNAVQETAPTPVSGIASLRLALAKEAHHTKTACVEKVDAPQKPSHDEAPPVLSPPVLSPQCQSKSMLSLREAQSDRRQKTIVCPTMAQHCGPGRSVSADKGLALQVCPGDRAPVISSMTHRFGAAGLDALVIFEAVCLFVGISQAFHVSLRSNPIGAAILICSVLLIGIFYSFLFKMSGTRTAGQTLLNS